MKTIHAILMCVMTVFTGCSSARYYLKDRGRDGLDVLTCAVEDQTLACSVQVLYPIGLSSSEGKGFGLREGYAGRYDFDEQLSLGLQVPY